MLRALLSALCITSLLGCSVTSTLAGGVDSRLPAAAEDGDVVRLLDSSGDTVHLRAGDELRVTTVNGGEISMRGSQVCRSQDGLSMRRSGDSCAGATWVAGWEDIASIQVDQFNGAATVGAISIVAVIVVGAIVVAVLDKDSKKGTSGSRGSSSGSHGPPVAAGGPGPGPATGGPAGGAVAHRPLRGPRGGGNGVGLGLNVGVLLIDTGPSSSVSPARTQPGVIRESTVGPLTPPPFDPTAEPLFSRGAIRRASVLPSLRFGLTGCVSGTRCTAESVRLGALLADLVEVSGGLRVEQRGDPSVTRYLGLVGLGLQGRFPTIPWLSVFLGSQLAVGVRTRVQPELGLRFQPFLPLQIGLNPVGVTFFTTEGQVAYTPSADLALSF